MSSEISSPWAAQIRGVVLVEGPDAEVFLQSQLSQDVASLGDGRGAWSLILQPEGRLGQLLRVTRQDDDGWILLPPVGGEEALRARLKRFAIRVKVSFSETQRWHGLCRFGTALPSDGIEIPSVLILVGGSEFLSPEEPVLQGPRAPYGEALHWHASIPAVDDGDVGDDAIPSELGEAAMNRAVSFTKGCYPGQELVARLDARSALPPRPLVGLESRHDIVVGSPIEADGDVVGHVLSACAPANSRVWRAIGVVKRSAYGSALKISGEPVAVISLV